MANTFGEMLTSAPLSISNFTVFSCPLSQARFNGHHDFCKQQLISRAHSQKQVLDAEGMATMLGIDIVGMYVACLLWCALFRKYNSRVEI